MYDTGPGVGEGKKTQYRERRRMRGRYCPDRW